MCKRQKVRMSAYNLLACLLLIPALGVNANILGNAPNDHYLSGGDVWSVNITPGQNAFLEIQNEGIDTIASALDANGTVISRSASWRGREGRYLLDLTNAVRVDVRSTEKYAASGKVVAHWVRANQGFGNRLETQSIQKFAQGSNYRVQGLFGAAIDQKPLATEAFQQSLRLKPDNQYAADIYYELGVIQFELGELDLAREYFQQTLENYQLVGNQRGVSSAYNMLGEVARRLGQSDIALRNFDQSLALRGDGDDFYQARILNNMGLVDWANDNYASAVDVMERALVLFAGRRLQTTDKITPMSAEQIGLKGNLTETVKVLNNLGLLNTSLGEIEQADKYWLAAARISKDINQPSYEAQAKFHLGRSMLSQGNLDKALQWLDAAEKSFSILNDKFWTNETLQVIGSVYASVDEHETAITYYQQALGLSGEDLRQRASTLNRLAFSNWHLHLTRKADEQYTEAFTSFISVDQRGSAAQVASRHAQLLAELGRVDEALKKQRDAFATLTGLGETREAARAQSRLGQLLLELGERSEAEQHLQSALKGHRNVNDELFELDTLTALSRAQNGSASLSSAKAATELANDIHLKTLSPDLQSKFLASRRGAYELYIDALVDAGDLEQGWLVGEQIRARSLLDLIQDGNNDTGSQNGVREQRDRLLSQLAGISKADNSARLNEVRREIDLLEGQLRSNKVQLADVDGSLNINAIQHQLGDGVTMLSYFVGANRSHLWAVGSDSIQHYDLPSAEQITPVTTKLTQALRSHRQSPSRIAYMAKELSEMVLRPAIDAIQGDELVVIADGGLQLVPFGLLPLSNEAALVENITVTYSPSATIFNLLEQKPTTPASNILVLADPLVEAASDSLLQGDDDLLASPASNFTNLMAQRSLRQSAVNISSLPGARLEAAAIAEAAASSADYDYGHDIKVMTGADASHQFVADGGLDGYGIVHFATHGIVDADLPELSALVLARDGQQSVSYLRPHEIASLDIDASLVVLSGCETGVGKSIGSEGLLSLSRPFLVAGARQVVSSLWQVSDQATALLMERFYFHMLQENKTPEVALQAAQQWFRAQPQWEHPYFWAGFVVQGSRSIEATTEQYATTQNQLSPPPTLVSAAL